MSINPENASQLQGKMIAVQKLGSSINQVSKNHLHNHPHHHNHHQHHHHCDHISGQLQQKEDYEGAMALYSKFQVIAMMFFFIGQWC